MPAFKEGNAQADRTDGRKSIIIRVASNGQVACQRIHLKPIHHRHACRRARATVSRNERSDSALYSDTP